jgi:class 3 adenylate cyclase
VRIGVHSGEVVGGVIGKQKFQFDLWGDNVEYANVMESEGVRGRVNLSKV